MLLGHFDFTDKLPSFASRLRPKFHVKVVLPSISTFQTFSINWEDISHILPIIDGHVHLLSSIPSQPPQKNNVVMSLTKRSFNSSSLGGCPNLQAAPLWFAAQTNSFPRPIWSHLKCSAITSAEVYATKKPHFPGVRSTRRVCWRLRECGNKAVCLSPMKPTSLMWNQIPKSQLRLVLFTSGQPIPDSSPFLGKSGWLGNHSELAGRYGWNMRESKPLDCCSILLWRWNACHRIIASSYHSQPTILKSKLRDMTQLRFHICRYSEQRSSLGFTTPSKSKNLRYTQSRDLSMYSIQTWKQTKCVNGARESYATYCPTFINISASQIRKHRTSLSSFVCFLFLLLCLPSPVFLCVVWSLFVAWLCCLFLVCCLSLVLGRWWYIVRGLLLLVVCCLASVVCPSCPIGCC